MNKIKILSGIIWVMLSVVTLSFVSCSDDDDDGVVLEVFGPSPVVRGGQITFIGKNLDRVTTVVFPEGIEVTAIEQLDGKIRVTVPQDAEVGYVLLRGNGFELSTKTLLTYTEDIVIGSFSPKTVKAGDVLTIEGDYLNLITNVVFADGVSVSSEEFITHAREQIQVTVPLEAQSGIITLTDDGEIPNEIASEEELTVVLPSVESIADLSAKKPGDVITVEVADIDLVESVELPNGDTVEFTVNGSSLSFTLPEGVTDGTISIVAYSGVKVTIATLGMAVPANLSVSPATGIRPGDVITITGNNMDLVTTVSFTHVDDVVELASQSATAVTVIMPEQAQSGELILNTASGNSTSVTIETLKPSVASYNPASVEVAASLTLSGAALDLVSAVTIGGYNAAISSIAESALTVTVPVALSEGQAEVVLTMNNGEVVTLSSLLTVTKPSYAFIPELPTQIKGGTIMTAEVENGSVLTAVQINSASVQFILQGSTLYISIPESVSGNANLTLISSNGSISYTISVESAGLIETEIMSDTRDLGNWAGEGDGGAFRLYKESFNGVVAGNILKFYFTVYGEGQLQLNNATWAQWGSILDFTDLSQTSYEIVLTDEFLNFISAEDGWSTTAMVIQGKNMIVSKVSVITGNI